MLHVKGKIILIFSDDLILGESPGILYLSALLLYANDVSLVLFNFTCSFSGYTLCQNELSNALSKVLLYRSS